MKHVHFSVAADVPHELALKFRSCAPLAARACEWACGLVTSKQTTHIFHSVGRF